MYILGQLIGATLGYGLLKVFLFLFSLYVHYSVPNIIKDVLYCHQIITPAELFNDGNPNSIGFCVTVVHPGISSVQAVLIEVFCTSFILCAACATWDPRCAHTTDSIALRFGLSVAALSFAAVKFFFSAIFVFCFL